MQDVKIQGFRLSPQQEHLWTVLSAEDVARCAARCEVRIEGALDPEALAQAVRGLVARHEILRTRFQCLPGVTVPLQVIGDVGPAAPPALGEHDLRALDAAAQDAFVERVRAELEEPFDLTHGAPLRLALLRLAAEERLLLLALPALACDEAGLENLVRELSLALTGGAEAEPVQYVDVSEWHHDLAAGEDGALGREHWREHRLPAAFATSLPGETAGAGGSIAMAAQRFALAPELAGRLEALAARLGVDLQAVLLAAWASLLGRTVEGEEMVLGAAFAGRRYDELKDVVGLLARHLPVRVPSLEGVAFADLAVRLGGLLGEAESWQEAFSWRDAAPEADAAPFLPFCFAFAEAPEALPAGPARFKVVDRRSLFDLFLVKLSLLRETSGQIRGELLHDAGRLAEAEAARMVERLQVLLESAVEEPGRAVERLRLLSGGERRHVLVEQNDTAVPLREVATIHQLFAEQAALHPERPAVVLGGSRLTYGELDARAGELAASLRGLGVGPDTIVGLCVERSLELAVGILGVLKAGGAYLPLDPAYPADRLAYMIEDSGAPVLLTQSHLAAGLPSHRARVICLDGGEPLPAAGGAARAGAAGAGHLAYVIYTSGSTGRPKGVGVSHGNLVHSTLARLAYYERPVKSFLLLSSFAFDSSVAGIFGSLCQGGTLVLPDGGPQLDPVQLNALIASAGITHMLALPSLYSALLAEARPGEHASLKTVIVAGEACPADLVARHHDRCPGALLYNEYGPTEGTVWSSVAALPRELPGGRVSIGRPIANTRAYLLDHEMEPVPAGFAGELLIGGPGLTRGYLRQPALTAERFVPDPFGGEPGRRLYRTGDLARWLPSREIDFLGRIDHQVKIRGFRIELGEIEAALLRFPGLREAVVVAREDEPGDKRLVAYLVPAGAPAPDLQAVRDALRQELPEHMVPSAFVPLDEVPRTPNGKVDRKALPAPGATRLRGELLAPRTPVEEVVAGIWADLLGLDAVGVQDNFFELGGHSLLATRGVSRLREAFRVDLTLPDLFAAPRVEQMAAFVEQALRAEVRLEEPPLLRGERTDRGSRLPLSFAQQRLWFLDQLEPGSTAYNVPTALRISGPLDGAALRRSLEEIMRRHEVLRTRFEAVDGRPHQVIAEEPELGFTVTDLRQVDAGEREERARLLAIEEIRRPFDLARGPLLRAALYELGDEDRVLLLTVHHIVSDLWSIGIFVRELSALYEAFSHGRPSSLPELPVQYADFARWQREWLQGEVLERQLAYWRDRLAGAPPALDLPVDRAPAAVRSSRAGTLAFSLPGEALAGLRQLGRGNGATLFMTLLGLYQVLLGRFSAQRDLCVGVPIAGRTRVETEPLIGFFVNTLALRCDLSGDPSFRDLLAQVRQTALGAYTHQELPFEVLVEDLQPERELSRSPLFQVLFTLQNAAVGELRLGGGVQVEPVTFEEATSTPFDLSLSMRELAEELAGSLEYAADLFDEETARRMLSGFRTLVEGAVADPGRRLSELPLLSAGELRQVLVDWNQTATGHDREQTLPRLFARQAAATPGAVALCFRDAHLTYRELDERADRLARHLRSLGVGPEARVGVLLERSPDLVAAILGVLKAGGAYVPLDPAYPQERLDFMLADSGARALLTQPGLAAADRPGVQTVLLEPGLAGLPESREAAPEPSLAPQNLALVIYTSGSTGVPKGVAIQHRSVAALLGWAGDVFPPEDLAGVLASTSVCFDLSVFELFLPLCRGGRVILVEDVLRLAEAPAADQVTLINTVPSAIAQLLELGAVPASVRTVNLAGEPLRGDLVDRIYAATPARRVLNLYGPSEDTTYSTWAEVPPGSAFPTIGRPGGDTQVYLLDAGLRPAPLGALGELCLGGAGLARGYLGRPALTAERFVPDPFGFAPGGRLYRTGDLARYQADGQIRFLRRIDHQVKIRGFRIELGEIEAALHRHPAVAEAVVVAREDRPGERRLVAYCVAAGGAEPAAGELRTFLGQTLPGYMVPSVFVALDAMPRTPNGKLDRKALPLPGAARTEAGAAYAPPRNPVEERMAEIWAEVLGIDRVGIHDNFFDLGGHSLLATQVIARVRQSFDVELPLRSLFEKPTVAALGEAVEAARPVVATVDKIAAALARIEELSSEEVLALLAEQGR
ncbi:MAG TPA: amino acid adenylation domain-containing protein [Thermoanaerobaculia bacterium]|nr:amino acid adenylation domain-containing protein [Thermoanaerobaculia bacterium]